ncbi:MAG: MazG nucleotide pyrophosphohydrolase domain-containing protein [Parachlamydiales bacterium]
MDQLKNIIDTLMGPDGCPWDRKQTFESLRSGLREEVEEVIAAVEGQDHDNLKEELGDVLMILFLYAGIAEKRNLFTLNDVVKGTCEKLIHRHPHVFGEEKAATAEEALAIWRRQKGVAKKAKIA